PGGRHDAVRSSDRGRQDDVRAAAPAVSRVCVRVCERTERPGPWEAHGGAARPRPARAGIRAAGAARQEVTLGRLVLAWLPVAVVFIVIGGLGARFCSAAGPDASYEGPRPE